MGKWRGRSSPTGAATNGHMEDNSSSPLRRMIVGGDAPRPTVSPADSSATNGRSPVSNGPCKERVMLDHSYPPGKGEEGLPRLPPPPYADPEEVREEAGDGDEEEEEDGKDQRCGIGPCQPSGMQSWANKKVFLAVFCLTSVLQGMYYTYFVSVLTTIEKLFQIQSKTTGIIMSATEMGQIGGALLLTYYGGQGHRPRWIACGMVIFAAASFLCSLPHFMFGDELTHTVRMAGALNQSQINQQNLCAAARTLGGGGGGGGGFTASSSLADYSKLNSTVGFLEFGDVNSGFSLLANSTEHSPYTGMANCEKIDSENHARITQIVLTIFFVSLLFIGIGATAVYTLGIPYIDDNVANRDSPLYFAITIGVRILGPVFGFLLGSFCTSLYVDPFEVPIFNSMDPRWIGAWWLGLFIVAAALMVSSFAMFAFPKKLPQAKRRGDSQAVVATANCNDALPTRDDSRTAVVVAPQGKKPNLKAPAEDKDGHLMNGHKGDEVAQEHSRRLRGDNNFPVAVKRLLRNDILLCRTASSVLHILPIAGLYTFLPKYMESQFRMTATDANMVVGIAGILVMGVGIFASGICLRRYRPNPRFVAGWIAFTALAYAVGMIILMFLGCPLDDFASREGVMDGIGIKLTCNDTCVCNMDVFAPVCASDGITYYSACHGGCQTHFLNQTGLESIETFTNCTCMGPNLTATAGYCPLDCTNFVWYICIFSLFVLIHSTSEVGSMLLTLRCVDPKDKAMALGLISFAIGLFGNVPCPIIYGAVVDSACLVWEKLCGERGACRLYDPSLFRLFFHGMTGAIMFAAFVVDVVVWYKAKNINFLDEDVSNCVTEEEIPMNRVPSQNVNSTA